VAGDGVTRGAVGVCEQVLADHDALERCVSIEPRRREDQHADLRLLFADRAWLLSRAGSGLVRALQQHPALADVSRHRSAIALRFGDDFLAELEERLAAGQCLGMEGSRVLAGSRLTVGLVGPNTNKALHVGHLRNIVLGHALAAAMTSGGATVRRHNLVGDIGRRVCEAMAGYLAGHAGEDPQTAELPGDRFVEMCCRDFARSSDLAFRGSSSEPNAEETAAHGDVADEIMHAWLCGSTRERLLWRGMRAWALAGHHDTLTRLGVCIDHHDFESDGLARALELIERGLRIGLFEREASGAVVYHTGRSEYATLVLLRSDSAPTEYARLLGVYHQMYRDLLPGEVYVEVVGIEWRPVMMVLSELLSSLLGEPTDARFTWAFHGSVTVDGQKIGSSTGDVKWIDDLLDDVAAGPNVAALQELVNGTVPADELADLLVRASFLCSPTTEPFAFPLELLLHDRSGPGWTIAEAWCRTRRASAAPTTVPMARTALVQSQLYPRVLRRALAQRDTAGLASYLLALATACLLAPAPGRATAAMLDTALSSLGFSMASMASEDGGGSHRADVLSRQTGRYKSETVTPLRLTRAGHHSRLVAYFFAPVAQMVKDREQSCDACRMLANQPAMSW
jgi:arginyl-tRNA synthetase